MINDPNAFRFTGNRANSSAPLPSSVVKTCHIQLPDLPKPVGAVAYRGQLYSYVKFFPTLDAAQRAYDRLVARNNVAILTQVPKGLVLWVLEPDAQLVSRPSTRSSRI